MGAQAKNAGSSGKRFNPSCKSCTANHRSVSASGKSSYSCISYSNWTSWFIFHWVTKQHAPTSEAQRTVLMQGGVGQYIQWSVMNFFRPMLPGTIRFKTHTHMHADFDGKSDITVKGSAVCHIKGQVTWSTEGSKIPGSSPLSHAALPLKNCFSIALSGRMESPTHKLCACVCVCGSMHMNTDEITARESGPLCHSLSPSLFLVSLCPPLLLLLRRLKKGLQLLQGLSNRYTNQPQL